jgi:hypothetical protein
MDGTLAPRQGLRSRFFGISRDGATRSPRNRHNAETSLPATLLLPRRSCVASSTRASATVWRWKEFPPLTSRAPRLAEKETVAPKRAVSSHRVAQIERMEGVRRGVWFRGRSAHNGIEAVNSAPASHRAWHTKFSHNTPVKRHKRVNVHSAAHKGGEVRAQLSPK